MQEINELKNLVIQSLEGNGTLGQIRAQIRASVFKTIEMQEANSKKNGGFFWENPLCQSIYDHKEGKLALELINDFLEFFKMDYTQSVFSHESNLKDALKRDDLKKELGVRGEGNKPVLFHIISALVSGGGITSPNKENLIGAGATKENLSVKTTIGASQQQQQKPAAGKNISTDFQDADLGKRNFDNFGAKNKKTEYSGFNEPKEEIPPAKGGKLPGLSSLSPQGNLSSSKPSDSLGGFRDVKKPVEEPKKFGAETKKPEPYGAAANKYNVQQESDDEYGEEVFENVDEELVEDLEEEEDTKYKDRKSMLTSSEDIIGASQSQGFDVSVDSLALEEYDYFENAERNR